MWIEFQIARQEGNNARYSIKYLVDILLIKDIHLQPYNLSHYTCYSI